MRLPGPSAIYRHIAGKATPAIPGNVDAQFVIGKVNAIADELSGATAPGQKHGKPRGDFSSPDLKLADGRDVNSITFRMYAVGR